MEEIKYLFVGKEPYYYKKKVDNNSNENEINKGDVNEEGRSEDDVSEKNAPKYTNIQLPNYPSKNVAFFPKFNSDIKDINKESLKIVSFRRILGILYNMEISKDDDFAQKFGKENPEQLALHLQEKGIYFCNLNELNGLNESQTITLNDKNDTDKWLISKNTKLLCFGSDPISKITKKVIENNLPLENLSTFPHPAKNNSHIIWQHYDKEFNPTTYNLKLQNLPDLDTLK
ncbi:hypothetical protein [Staphylococcus shinii]|uniref:hypothetical protein n=1 Tax=Staphylococcus shinii TaxID=2912228 RepID=UPI003CE7BD8D